jgi:PKD repeat protein
MAALLCAVAFSGAQAATVQFQGRTYVISIISPAPGVPLYSTNDLMFVQDQSGAKFLCIPSDVNLRGDFDISQQKFFVLDQTQTPPTNVVSFNQINGTLIDLNGNFIKTLIQDLLPTPAYAPLSAPLVSEIPIDMCLINSSTFGYRTDGTTDAQAKIYTLTRTSSASTTGSFVIPFFSVVAGFITFDIMNNNYLTVQRSEQTANSTDTRRRISAFNPSTGLLADEIILDALDPSLGYTGNTGGMTIDPSTGTIYLLDAGSSGPPVVARKVFAFTPLLPQISSVTPKNGSFAGGTQVTLTGINFPPDSAVFFGGVAATNITVVSTTTITATTPVHAPGAVDVTVTGTGIPTLTLVGGYTYVNEPPVPVLNASPTQGPAPLAVAFNVGGTTDIDDPIVTRILAFGDGNTFTFPSDLTIVNVAHTYTANGTFTATFTATDSQGASASTTVVIIVGSGGADIVDNNLVLRQLSFKIKGANKDTVNIRGEIIIPSEVSLGDATLAVGFAGAEFDATMNSDGKTAVAGGANKFTIRPLKKRGFDPDTQTFTLKQGGADLRAAFTAAGLDLTKSGPQTMTVFIRFDTSLGRIISHTKLNAVVTVKAGSGTNGSQASISLKRD